MTANWIQNAENILTEYQWGAHGRFLGISRMFKEEDLYYLQKGKFVASLRPRGVLSGFLVIAPTMECAVYIPPLSARIGPKCIRMRVKPFKKPTIFSVYWSNESQLLLEDVLVWDGEPVWFSKSFEIRWNVIMKEFIGTWLKSDPVFQGITIECTKYQSLSTIEQPTSNTVVEFTPIDSKKKRWIWINSRIQKETGRVTEKATEKVTERLTENKFVKEHTRELPVSSNEWIAKKESESGPDVYSIVRSGENQGYGLVRTLAISRALRNSNADEIPVKVTWNSNFSKWEILEVM